MSGFLYLAIVLGWAFYLVPFALRRYDEAARNRSVDRFSSEMRILGRSSESHDDDTTTGRADTAEEASAHRQVSPSSRTTASVQARRRAAQVAARRRRRVLLTLLLATAGSVATAYLQLVPWWSVAVPGTLVLVWLVCCRAQVRREHGAGALRDGERGRTAASSAPAPHDHARTDPHGGVRLGIGAGVRDDTVPAGEPQAAQAQPQAAQARQHADEDSESEPGTVPLDGEPVHPRQATPPTGSLWDPVPVTLPTYVHKPRAPRTIRTIELTSAEAQSSGRADDRPRGTADSQPDRTGQAGQQAATAARAVGQ